MPQKLHKDAKIKPVKDCPAPSAIHLSIFIFKITTEILTLIG